MVVLIPPVRGRLVHESLQRVAWAVPEDYTITESSLPTCKRGLENLIRPAAPKKDVNPEVNRPRSRRSPPTDGEGMLRLKTLKERRAEHARRPAQYNGGGTAAVDEARSHL